MTSRLPLPAPPLGQGRTRTALGSARAKILASYVLLLVAALTLSLLVTRQVLRSDLNRRIDDELRSEVSEVQALARSGIDPQTGARIISTEALLRASLALRVPEPNAGIVALLDGRAVSHVGPSSGVRFDQDPHLIAAWAAPTDVTYGKVGSAAGTVRFAAVPVSVGATPSRGAFVMAVLATRDQQEVDRVVLRAGEASGGALVLASLLSWLVAGRVLRPVRQVTALANSIISESDLSGRLPVRGTDEISQLAATFNRMLDRLAEAFSAQRAFVNDAGHELRTPITVIRGHLDLPDGSAGGRAQTQAVVHDELDRMSRMVEDLLVLGRSERADYVVLDVLDLAELTRSTFAKAQTLSAGPWELEQVGTGHIVADRQRLTQAVLELARNAVRHTPAGYPIALGSSLTGEEARLWVRDRGPGVHPADRERIFKRFARAEGNRGAGSGLGLAIVSAIAEGHDGRVELASGTDTGNVFTIIVPVRPPAHPTDGEFA